MVGGDRHRVKCKWCLKKMSGGIHKFKQHLGHVSGDEKGCPNAPTDVRKQMRENLLVRQKRKERRRNEGGG